MKKIDIKIKLNGGIMPVKATDGAAAFDLCVPCDTEIKHGRNLVDMKFSIELPYGYAATIQPRSGFTAKGFEVDIFYVFCGTVLKKKNDVRIDADVKRGLIDADYRGNVRVIVYVRAKNAFKRFLIKKGTRIAQMQIVEVPQVAFIEADELSKTKRGKRGIGSTGTKRYE